MIGTSWTVFNLTMRICSFCFVSFMMFGCQKCCQGNKMSDDWCFSFL
jgi:hypothetical protein